MKPDIMLPYGRSTVQCTLSSANLVEVLRPRVPEKPAGSDRLLRKALENPIGSPQLRDLARGGQRVVIVTSDLTRPCPSAEMLPLVLNELDVAGVPDDDVTVVVALGLHRRMTEAELERAVGPEVYREVRILNHSIDDTVRVGVTQAGTPVEVLRSVVEADVRVCLGNVELHYFAGYSGGAKAIVPGCASAKTVRANHAMMVREEAAAGRLEGNPVRRDLEEATGMVGVDFILNAVVDEQHRVAAAVAGDVTRAHRRGCEIVARRGEVPIDGKADVVLVSAGGFPKDINLYQAQKALDNAAHAVRAGGVIVLVAECGEGWGNETFEAWMRAGDSPERMLERIKESFVLGGHKAAAVASVLQRSRVYLVSSLGEDVVGESGLIPFAEVDDAIEAACLEVGGEAKVMVITEGGAVLPVVTGLM